MGLSKESIINCLRESYGESVTSAEIKAFCNMNDFNYQTITNKLTDFKVGRGKWNLEVTKETVEELETTYNGPAALPAVEQNLIPQKDDTFVSFGNFSDVKKIIKSGLFYPTFITGLSGNGKTFSVEQACAQLGRELIRVNITVETDEDDLIGGFRLVGGETVWHNGPVIEALQRGAVLLLDEIDLASKQNPLSSVYSRRKRSFPQEDWQMGCARRRFPSIRNCQHQRQRFRRWTIHWN